MSLIIPANTLASGGYAVDNSLRFNDGSSDYLDATNGTPTNADRCTISCWVKRGNLVEGMILGNYSSASFRARFGFDSNHKLEYNQVNDGSVTCAVTTDMLFRDVSAWYHIVCAVDTTDGTASNRIKIYVNGTQVAVTFATNIAQNLDFKLNQASVPLDVGQDGNNAKYFDGYIAETVFIDGTQNAVTDFGEFDEDTGIWKPIDVSGLTFGTNGFYLDFEDSAALGDDVSGNGNDFTVNNLTAIDQTTDTPTNNFATMNPLDNYYAGATFSEGNLQVATTNSGKAWNTSTIALSAGKWYFEAKNSATGGTHSGDKWNRIGITDYSATSVTDLGLGTYQYAITQANGNKYVNGTGSTYAATWETGAVIGCAIDLENNKIYWSKDGAWSTGSGAWDSATFNAATGAVTIQAAASTNSGFYFVAMGDAGVNVSKTWQFNFGNAPYAISSGNTDGNSKGNFEYAVPSGYLSLCTANLSEVLG
jgi:hypothetical protein